MRVVERYMTGLRIHSEAAWDVASKFSHALASETRDLAAHIDIALAAERERIAQMVERVDNTMMKQDKLAQHIRNWR